MAPEIIQKANQVIDGVASGGNLKDMLELVGLHPKTFSRVVSSVRDSGLAYAMAREIASEIDVDEAVRIADDEHIDPQRARNMVEIRKWRASKYHSKLFGDRIEMQFSGAVSITDALSEARSRVPALIVDAEIVPAPTLSASRHPEALPTNVPDIFS